MKIVLKVKENNPYRKPLVRALVDYNEGVAPSENWQYVGFYAIDDDNALAGGIQGCFQWDWLHISHLWVREPKAGLGTKLMDMAEAYAREHGKRGVYLDTFAFQAKPFYEKRGYTVYGTIEEAAGPHSRYFLIKIFAV